MNSIAVAPGTGNYLFIADGAAGLKILIIPDKYRNTPMTLQSQFNIKNGVS
jgi:hypothetical protein